MQISNSIKEEGTSYPPTGLVIGNDTLEQVDCYHYLGDGSSLEAGCILCLPIEVPMGFHLGRLLKHLCNQCFPIKNSYNGSGLVVSSMDLSLNMTSCACFFSVYIGSGHFEGIQSNTGFLSITGLHITASGL